MEAITNSTVLIVLAKINQLGLLAIFTKITTTKDVYSEILAGKDVPALERAILEEVFSRTITRTRCSCLSQSQQAAGYYDTRFNTRVREILKLDHGKLRSIQPNFKIKIREPVKKLNLDLGAGETSALSLCNEEKQAIFLSDDRKARKTAEILGIKCVGTIGIILENLKRKKITKIEAKEIIKLIVLNSYYMTTDLYAKVIEFIENY